MINYARKYKKYGVSHRSISSGGCADCPKACCKDVPYDPATEGCCNGVVYN